MTKDAPKSQDKLLSKLTEEGIHVSEETLDVSQASWDESLSRVWVSETTGELCASLDRLTFESPLSTAVRFMEPQGFQINLENILACLDSMRFGVFAKAVSSKDASGRPVAKKIAPAVYMRLPQRSAKGPLLSRFYEEISRYEGELSRLQQFEAQSRRVMQEAVKDESGKSAVVQLQRDNDVLREEIERLSKKLGLISSALESVPMPGRENSMPHGVKLCQVRQVKESENLVYLKSDSGQYSFPLNRLQGVPTVGSRALAMQEGGTVRDVWIMDAALTPFQMDVCQVLSIQGDNIKVRRPDRVEFLILDKNLDKNRNEALKRGNLVLVRYANGFVIDFKTIDAQSQDTFAEKLFDEQVSGQISGSSNSQKLIFKREKQNASRRKRSAA